MLDEAEADRRERVGDGSWDGVYHLSVFADLLASDEDLDAAAVRLIGPHRKFKFYRVASVEGLLDAGFTLLASPPEPHHFDVALGRMIDESTIARFDGCFGEDRRNPKWHK